MKKWVISGGLALILITVLVAQALAWNCPLYITTISRSGTIHVSNNSDEDELGQEADVTIYNLDGSVYAHEVFTVPALPAGTEADIGNIATPGDAGFRWNVDMKEDCDTPGEYPPETATATNTSTPTDTPAPTHTPSATPSPNNTPTDTPTATHTSNPSATSTNTPLGTSTASVTPGRVSSATATASHTPGPSVTPTKTAPNPSQTPTATPNASITPTEKTDSGTVYLDVTVICLENGNIRVQYHVGGPTMQFHINNQVFTTDGELELQPGDYYWKGTWDQKYSFVGEKWEGTISAQVCEADSTSTPETGIPPKPSGGGWPLGFLGGITLLLLLALGVFLLLLRKKDAA